MGLQKRDKITYLKITEGKIRAKAEKGEPGVEERYVERNEKYVYEHVFSTCSGYLRDIRTQVHEEYGTSYNLIMVDPAGEGKDEEKFSLNMGEQSRYFQSLAQHLPEIDFAKPLEVKPFKFKKDSRESIGIAFSQEGEKVPNHYKDWDPDEETSTPKNGLEKFNFKKAKGDKEEMKILQIKLLKFWKDEVKREIRRLADFVEKNGLPKVEVPESGEVSPPDGEEAAPAADKPGKRDAAPKKEPQKKDKKKAGQRAQRGGDTPY